MIKCHNMGVKGKVFNWIMEFLSRRSIHIKTGSSQGSVESPILFSMMINDIFVLMDIGRSMGKGGKNMEHSQLGSLQEGNFFFKK